MRADHVTPPVRRLGAEEVCRPEFVDQVSRLVRQLVSDGAALGWVDPPSRDEIVALLRR